MGVVTADPNAALVSPDSPAAGAGMLTDDCAAATLAELSSLSRDEAVAVADLFKILGDPTRVRIMHTLTETGELCVHHLAEAVDMSPSSVSHHLRLLRSFGLIHARRAGREVYYRPDDTHVEQLLGVCLEHVRHRLPGAAGIIGAVAVPPRVASVAGTVDGTGGSHSADRGGGGNG